jgi:TPR repeat protein
VQGTQLGIPSTMRLLANVALASGESDATGTASVPASNSCSAQAAAPYDPERRSPGVDQGSIRADVAMAACARESGGPDPSGQLAYHTGRALRSGNDLPGARRALEAAVAKGYRAARLDLGQLLVDPDAARPDPVRAVSLFEQAWQSGLSIAGFELGALYEHGVPAKGPAGVAFPADAARAWAWYQRAAAQSEPNALARFGARAEHQGMAAAGRDANALWLEAFTYYARAAERARQLKWPDGAWRVWRYRRSSLARLLAGEGMMQQTADAYKGVLRIAPP